MITFVPRIPWDTIISAFGISVSKSNIAFALNDMTKLPELFTPTLWSIRG